MKNITFDESSVLQEFLKIAEKKDLLGDGNRTRDLPEKKAEQQKYPFMTQLEHMNKYWAQLRRRMNENRARPLFEKELNRVMKLMNQKYKHPMFGPLLAQFPALARQLTRPEQAKVESSVENEISKEAKSESLYDVSGETGEDLVNSAHPGKMRTELTHSKTDENLVETIVEQQERDIEVATKVPKGVYAALTDLADRLDKLGYAKVADEVDALIKKASRA